MHKAQANAEAGRKVRDDGFFEEQIDGRSAADEIVEGTVVVSQREYEERKIPFYGNLLGNIGFSSTVDRGYANLLLRIGERLSYRQLCLLHIVENWERLSLSHRPLRERSGRIAETELVAVQELFGLYNEGLIRHAQGAAWLEVYDATLCGSSTFIGRALYQLMELSELPLIDINETARLFASE